MSLFDTLLSFFGLESKTTEPAPSQSTTRESEPDAAAESAEAEDEEEEDGDEAMHSGAASKAADPRRSVGEEDTVGDRAANPDDHAGEAGGEEAEAEDEGDEEEEDGGPMHSGAASKAADPRRSVGEEDTVGDRAVNPDDHGTAT